MTQNYSLPFVRLFPFHHALTRVFVLVTSSVLLSAPWVAAQAELPPPPPPLVYPYINPKVRVNPTVAIILVCLISTFFVMGCISVYVRHFIERRMARRFALEADGHSPGRRTRAVCGLDPGVVDSFPTFIYSEVKGLKIGNASLECAVCLNEFEDDETLRLLPNCSHVFHPDCIDVWLSSHITCPVCRANLMPIPGETSLFTFPSHDPDSDFSAEIQDPDPENLNSDDLIVTIQSPEAINTIVTPNRNGTPRSTPRKERNAWKLRRSNTTGHSLVKPGENCERFTLKLPEEVRNRLVNSSLSRTNSCVAFPRARSSRKGYRSGSARRSDRWVFMATPPFFSRTGSVRSREESSTATPKILLKTVTSPLNRLFKRTDNNKDNVNDGERSFDRLRVDGQV